jgi:hypothetical protein
MGTITTGKKTYSQFSHAQNRICFLAFSLSLEHLEGCSECDPAQYNWMKKSQNVPVWFRKMVLVQLNWRVSGGW